MTFEQAFRDELQKLALSEKAKKRLRTVGVAAGIGLGLAGAYKAMKVTRAIRNLGEQVGGIFTGQGRGYHGSKPTITIPNPDAVIRPNAVKTGMAPYTPARELAPAVVTGGEVRSEEEKPRKKRNLFALFGDDIMMMLKKIVPGREGGGAEI